MVKVGVAGSISTDFVVSAPRRPQQGETIYGESFGTSFGGKGANQAVASARLGGETKMIGAVGTDEFGGLLIDNLNQNNIETTHVAAVPDFPSGAAVITMTGGDNSIIYVPGANAQVTIEMISQAREMLKTLDIILVQNETPQESVEHLIDLCQELGVPIILNPAPARAIGIEYIQKLDYLTPNETEFAVIFQDASLEEVLPEYPNKLIVTLGSEGAVYHNDEEIVRIPAFITENVVDTTGAGDTFNGAFAVAAANKFDLLNAIKFANLASSLSIQKHGAQTGIPTLAQMKESENYEETWHIE